MTANSGSFLGFRGLIALMLVTALAGFAGAVNLNPDGSPNPGDSNLVAWWKADDGAMMDDGGGGEVAATDGSRVTTWVNQIGANDATQITVANQPTYIAAIAELNNMPALDFTKGGDQSQLFSDVIPGVGTSPRTIIAVFIDDEGDNHAQFYAHVLHYGDGFAMGAYGIAAHTVNQWGHVPQFDFRVGNHYWGQTFTSSLLSTTEPVIVSISFDGLRDRLWGNSKFSGVREPAINTGGARGITIGAIQLRNGGEGFDGKIAEVIAYDVALNEADRSAIEGYLAQKYGLLLDPEVPVVINPDGTPKTDDPNLVAWWKADAGVITDDGSGGDIPAVDGSFVKSWTNQTGGSAARLPFGDTPPVFRASVAALNGMPAIDFPIKRLKSDIFPGIGNEPRTIITVFVDRVGNQFHNFYAHVVHYGQPFLGPNGDWHTGGTFGTCSHARADFTGGDPANYYRIGNHYWGEAGNSTIIPSLDSVVVTNEYDGIINRFYGNSEDAGENRVRCATGQVQGLVLGSIATDGGGEYFDGYIAEVIAYSTTLTTTQRRSVEAYLMDKYAVVPKTEIPRSVPTVSTTPPDPADARLLAWYKADAIALGDGEIVDTWPDSSDNGNDATRAGGEPVLVENVLGGNPAVRFHNNIARDWFDCGFVPPIGAADRSFFAVVTNTDTRDNLNHIFHYGSQNCDQGYGLATSWAGQFTPHYWCGANPTLTGFRMVREPHIFSSHYMGTAAADILFADGQFVHGVNKVINTGSDVNLLIGSRISGNAESLDGDIAEILVYDSALTLAERRAITEYLAVKYGIPITEDPGTGGDALNFTDFTDVSALQLNGHAVQSGDRLRLTPSAGSQRGSAFTMSRVTFSGDYSFNTRFAFEISAPGGGGEGDGLGADGMVFAIQDAAPRALGQAGGSLGLGGVHRFLAVEFDTWAGGSWDPAGNNGSHIAIDASTSLVSIAQSAELPRFNDGGVKYCWVDYDGGTDLLEVYYADADTKPGTPVVSTTINLTVVFAGSPDLHVGFTAGTGGAIEAHEVLSWSFSTVPSLILAPTEVTLSIPSSIGPVTQAITLPEGAVAPAGGAIVTLTYDPGIIAVTKDASPVLPGGTVIIPEGRGTVEVEVQAIGRGITALIAQSGASSGRATYIVRGEVTLTPVANSITIGQTGELTVGLSVPAGIDPVLVTLTFDDGLIDIAPIMVTLTQADPAVVVNVMGIAATPGADIFATADGYVEGTAVWEVTTADSVPGDVNGDGCVNVADLLTVRNNLGNTDSEIFPEGADVSPQGDPDGVVNVADLLFVRNRLGDGEGCQ